MRKTTVSLCAAALTLGSAALPGGELRVRSNFPEGVAQPGSTAEFTVHYSGQPVRETAVRVRVFRNGIEVRKSEHPLGKDVTEKEPCSAPGWIAVTAELLDSQGKPTGKKQLDPEAGCGVLVSPEKITRSRPRPADFEVYWQRKKAELARVPMTVKRTPVAVPAKAGDAICEDVQISAWHDIPVSGILLMPRNAAPKSLPAVVYYQGAGLRSGLKQPEFASRAIVLDINAHGLPNGHPVTWYRALARKDGRDRVFRQRSDLENAYLNGLFLRVVRSLDFIRSLPEWNGRDLIVFGRSQGGAQAIAAAALVPEVTLCIANVPALGDHGGYACGRLPGWPLLNRPGKDAPDVKKLAAVSDYFDIVNFTPMIRCPIRMTAGLIDFTCPPTSVLAAYGELPRTTVRSIQYFPTLGHAAPTARHDGRDRIRKELKK